MQVPFGWNKLASFKPPTQQEGSLWVCSHFSMSPAISMWQESNEGNMPALGHPNRSPALAVTAKFCFPVNTLRPRQNGRRFADDTFKRIFWNENVRILITISLKFIPKGPINNNPALVQIMSWRCPGDKPLSEPMMVSYLTHICVTRPQWVNSSVSGRYSRNFRSVNSEHMSQIKFISTSCDSSHVNVTELC